MSIPFIDLKAQQSRIREKIDTGIANVLDSNAYIMGPPVAALETRLAEWAGAKHAVSCSSGTDALLLALHGLGLQPGQGVIVPSFTFAASCEVMPTMGAIPVFAEVDPVTFNIDPAQLDAALTAGRDAGIEVVGIIGVGLFGQPADFDAIISFARNEGLWVIDDAAQSFGARLGGRPVGKLADVTCTSFFPAKPLGCYGDGGAVFTDNDEIAEIMRSCRIHGMGKDKYENIRIGMTGRLDTIQAVVLDAKLDIFASELVARQSAADLYEELLGNHVETPRVMAGATSSWAQYTIKLPASTKRARFCEKMQEAGVPTAIYYPIPMHQQPPYTGYPVANGALATTATLCDCVVALPMHPYLNAETQTKIVEAVRASL